MLLHGLEVAMLIKVEGFSEEPAGRENMVPVYRITATLSEQPDDAWLRCYTSREVAIENNYPLGGIEKDFPIMGKQCRFNFTVISANKEMKKSVFKNIVARTNALAGT
jgi:hypothetical protein